MWYWASSQDDAPIDLADDTEDEQEQQQLETSPVLNQQQQQQAGDAAQQVSGPAAAARTRRHNNIVNLLGEGVQGTALTFAVSGTSCSDRLSLVCTISM